VRCSVPCSTAVLTPGQPNILVDDSGNARIVDFGLTTVTHNLDSMRSASHHGHTPRWTAPEVLNGGGYSKEADIFAFAMVMVEVRRGRCRTCGSEVYFYFMTIQVFTGAVPFGGDPSPVAMFSIMQGKRPPRPTHPILTENLWALMQRCWDCDPHLRPEASEALQVLLTLSVLHSPQQLHIC